MQKEIYVAIEEVHKKDYYTHKHYNDCYIEAFSYDKPERKNRLTFEDDELTRYLFRIIVTYDGRKKTITENDILKNMDNLGYIDYKDDGNMFPTFNLKTRAKHNSLDTQKIYNYKHVQNFTTQVKNLLNKHNVLMDKVEDVLGTTDTVELIDKGLTNIEKTLINY